MSRIVIITCALLLGIAVIAADNVNRRVKSMENRLNEVEGECLTLNFVRESAYKSEADIRAFKKAWPAAEIRQLQIAVNGLQQQTNKCELDKCSCPPAKPCNCCSCFPCDCKPCKCCCGNHRGVERKAPAKSRFCEFLMIQLFEGAAWFKWLDVDGGEHETRIPLVEFERWSEEE